MSYVYGMHSRSFYFEAVEKNLSSINFGGKPDRLYDPIRYMISLGGKRLRPVLMLMSNELFGGSHELILGPASGIEVFHNFTLLHDDIMDNAPLRRSKETVHRKWNRDIAILSGDAMFVRSCELMMQSEEKYLKRLLSVFFKTAIDVCEGQQFDMDYENENEITIDEYIKMITLKTASLIACCANIGAITADANEEDCLHMYNFGLNLGITFQIHDDILDAFGDSLKFGKRVGGDILSNKKTILLLLALQYSSGENKKQLKNWLAKKEFDSEEKIASVISIYNELNVRQKGLEIMDSYFRKSLYELDRITSVNSKEPILELTNSLMVREQ
jgi:geranylgeranyl diphosphate synthase type II